MTAITRTAKHLELLPVSEVQMFKAALRCDLIDQDRHVGVLVVEYTTGDDAVHLDGNCYDGKAPATLSAISVPTMRHLAEGQLEGREICPFCATVLAAAAPDLVDHATELTWLSRALNAADGIIEDLTLTGIDAADLPTHWVGEAMLLRHEHDQLAAIGLLGEHQIPAIPKAMARLYGELGDLLDEFTERTARTRTDSSQLRLWAFVAPSHVDLFADLPPGHAAFCAAIGAGRGTLHSPIDIPVIPHRRLVVKTDDIETVRTMEAPAVEDRGWTYDQVVAAMTHLDDDNVSWGDWIAAFTVAADAAA